MPLKYNMRLIASFILVFVLALPAFSQNVVLINGSVIDGTGKARALGSLRIRDGKIADVGVFKLSPGETLIDVKGMIIAPGFVWRPLRHAYGGNTDRSVDRYGNVGRECHIRDTKEIEARHQRPEDCAADVAAIKEAQPGDSFASGFDPP